MTKLTEAQAQLLRAYKYTLLPTGESWRETAEMVSRGFLTRSNGDITPAGRAALARYDERNGKTLD